MRKMLISAAVIGLAIGSQQAPAFAACDSICQQKCADTAKDVPACIIEWAERNKDPVAAKQAEANFYRDNPEFRKFKYKKYH